MIIVQHSADSLKRFIGKTVLGDFARLMVMRIVLAFIMHRGRMSCSSAAGIIASESIHRGQLTRFLARPRWQKEDFNASLRAIALELETRKGRFIFIVDATMFSQSGAKTQNTYSTGNRQRRSIKRGSRYNKKKVHRKSVHCFTYGLLISPSGIRVPFQIPHYTKEYCLKTGLKHMTTAQAAEKMILELPLPKQADVLVLGDTAYDASSVRRACETRGYK